MFSRLISAWRWPVIFLLALVALDTFVARSEIAAHFLTKYSDIAFDNPLRFFYKFRRAARDPAKPLVIFLGSSVAREGFDEEIVQAELRQSAQVINLGFFHGRPVDLWMLSDQLMRLQPALVVLPMNPGDILLEYSYRLTMPYYFSEKIFELVGTREVIGNWREFFYAGVSRASVIFRYRDSIGSALLRFGQDQLGLEPWRKNEEKFRFYQETEHLPDLDSSFSFFGQDFRPDYELSVRAMERLLRFFSERRIRVVLVPMPSHPKLDSELLRLQRRDLSDFNRTVFPRFLSGWSAAPGVNVAALPASLLRNSDFSDYVHVNAGGREKLSRWFANWLSESKLLEAKVPGP